MTKIKKPRKSPEKKDPNIPDQYYQYKNRARLRDMDFQLGIHCFIDLPNNHCYYCGGQAQGFDRIDPNQGYTIDNSVHCCTPCNMMKYTYSTEFFLGHINKIYSYQK